MQYNKYEKLNSLRDLLENGTITKEEFEIEKEKILSYDEKPATLEKSKNKNPLFGMEENSFLMLMHLSQFAGWISAGLGFIIPLLMWITNKDTNEHVDKHGKMILNFSISYFIYTVISLILIVLVIGIPLLIILGLIITISIIIATIKANNGEFWHYPLVITFIK